MSTVKACAIPNGTLVAQSLKRIDYVDTFCSEIPNDSQVTLEELARTFFNSTPGWIKGLMGLRNRLVKPLGLKTGDTAINEALEIPQDQRFDAGTTIGIFKIIERSADELVMGEDDRHLDFRVGLIVRKEGNQRLAFITTVVQFNNWLGKAYFLPVKHFHRLIVPAMFKRMLIHSNNKAA